MRVMIVHNVPAVTRDLQRVLDGLQPVLTEIARFADTRISARAVSVYMQNAGVHAGPRPPEDTDRRLRQVSGDLSRAVLGKGGMQHVSVVFTIAALEYTKTITVPYAAIQHYGGTIRLRVTSRMRRFFWAKFIETGDEKWKGMALSKKTHFEIKIKARPYVDPAVEDESSRIQDYADRQFAAYLQKTLVEQASR